MQKGHLNIIRSNRNQKTNKKQTLKQKAQTTNKTHTHIKNTNKKPQTTTKPTHTHIETQLTTNQNKLKH